MASSISFCSFEPKTCSASGYVDSTVVLHLVEKYHPQKTTVDFEEISPLERERERKKEIELTKLQLHERYVLFDAYHIQRLTNGSNIIDIEGSKCTDTVTE
jgi:hypothetical protein